MKLPTPFSQTISCALVDRQASGRTACSPRAGDVAPDLCSVANKAGILCIFPLTSRAVGDGGGMVPLTCMRLSLSLFFALLLIASFANPYSVHMAADWKTGE